MGPKRLSSLAFNVLLLIIRTTAHSNNVEHNSYQTISLLGKTQDNCACFKIPENAEKVTSLLNQFTNYKRLVIYLYQDNYSKEVYLHIPNLNKQRLFPNQYIEDGDILKLITKTTLLPDIDITPNAVILQHETIGEESANNIEGPIPNNNAFIPYISDEDQSYLQEYPNHISNGEVDSYDIDSPLWIQPPKHTANIQDYDLSNDYGPIEIPPFDSDEIKFDGPFSQKYQYQTDSLREPLDAVVSDVHVPRPAELNPLSLIEMLVGNNPEQPGSNIIHIKKTYPKHNQNSFFPLKNDNEAPFKQWLIHQLGNINETSDVNENQRNIESNIQKVLKENGIIVLSNGALVNQYGQRLDPYKLQIRPILIGDSIQFYKLMAELKRSSNLPLDLPYLHALIISYIDRTPKVLGVVPIRKVHLAKNKNAKWWGGKSYVSVSGYPQRWKQLGNQYYSTYNTQHIGAGNALTQYGPVPKNLRILNRPLHVFPAVSTNRGPIVINRNKLKYSSGPNVNIDDNGKLLRTDYSQKEVDQEDLLDNIQDPLYASNEPHWESVAESGIEDMPRQNSGESEINYLYDALGNQNDDKTNYGDEDNKEISDGGVFPQNPSDAVNPDTVYQRVAEPDSDLTADQLDERSYLRSPSYRRNLIAKLFPNAWEIIEKFIPPVFKKKPDKAKQEVPEESEEDEDEEEDDEEDKPGYRIIGGSPATGSGAPLSSKGRSGYEENSLIL